MDTKENALSPEESLEIIKRTIMNSRRNMREGSFYYLLWGWVLILGSIGNYALIYFSVKNDMFEGLYLKSTLNWAVVVAVGLLIQFIYRSRSGKKQTVQTYLDRFLTILWASAGASMAFIVFFCFKYDILPIPYIMIITALATFVSGSIVRYTPLMAGAFVFAAGAVLALYMEGAQLIIFAGSIVLGYLIPGYMLRNYRESGDV